jgi:hypothetical protein
MEIDHVQPGFTYLLLERVNPEQHENRFYYLAWQPLLFAEGAMVRTYGRKDGRRAHARTTPLPFVGRSLAVDPDNSAPTIATWLQNH